MNEDKINLVTARLKEILGSPQTEFSDIFNHILLSQGKLIRTRFSLLCCEKKVKAPGDRLINSLCAIEILHLATLIHDDIIDGSSLRRGLPSVPCKFGQRDAVLAGDYLFTLCFSLISESFYELTPYFAKAISLICLGEMKQNQNLYNYDLTFRQYIKIISGKTAALFSLSSAVSGKFSDCSRRDFTRLVNLGHKTGILFQINDDINDFSCTAIDGKPIGLDRECGVVTLPDILSDNLTEGLLRARKISDLYLTKVQDLSKQCDVDISPIIESLPQKATGKCHCYL
ncbi:MAG: polyprenyl synthetase family protein [Oscillospiraceae bacterium]